MALLISQSVLATTLYVKANATGSNNGTSWTNAYTSLQSALTAAVATDEIWVAAGTYYPTAGIDRSISFVMKNSVKIYGGFAGIGTETSLSQRNYSTNITILSGDIGTVSVNTDNSYHVVSNSNLNNTAILDGFTITKGNANGGIGNSNGGGMYNGFSSPTITNCTFTANAANRGGGMYNSSSSPTITNCTFSANTATFGGGMYNDGSSPTITNCTFSANTGSSSGGGIENNISSSPTITNCTFSANTAYAGGGIDNFGSNSTTIANCTFSANTATFGGGGIYYSSSSSGTIKNSIFYQNTGDSPNRKNIYKDGTTALNVSNSLVDDYSATNSINITWGTGIITSNPLFFNSADPDGVDNIFRTADDGLTLSNCSPAINAGDNADVAATDILGNSRIFNTTVDLGAYEYQSATISPVSSPTVISANPSIICSGATASLSASCATGNVAWYGSNSTTFLQTGSPYVTPTLSTNTTYNVRCTNAGCSSAFVPVTVTQVTAPTGTSNPTICSGATASLSATCAAGSPVWYDASSVAIPFTGSPFVTPNLTTATTYNVRCESGTCLSSFVAVNVSINAVSTPTGTSNPTICSGATASLSATCATGTVKWYASNSTSFLYTGSPYTTPALTTNTTYNVRCTNGTCNSDFVAVNVTLNTTTRLYVDATKTTGANTGLTWANAFTDLQSALNYNCFTNSAEIWVATGTYKPTTGNDKTKSFVMKNNLAIYGGFAGTETLLSQRNYSTNITILSGDIGTANDNTDNSYHVVLNTSINSTAILDGFTITKGNPATSTNLDGGGMNNISSSPTISNCTFSNNTSGNYGVGGGMYNTTSSNPTITNCTFSNNTTGTAGNGGGMSNNDSSPIISNCTFNNNTAKNFGGAINNVGGSPSIINCTFTANGNSSGTGGGVYYDINGAGTIKNCIFYKNIGNSANRNNIYKNGTTTALNVSYSIVDDYDATNSINITWGLGIIASNPFFVNDADPDGLDNIFGTADDGLRLTNCSSAINAGENTGVSATDILGNPRIFNTTVDLGAYEFQSNTIFPVSNPIAILSNPACSGMTTTLSATCTTGIVNWYDASSAFLATGSSYVTPNLTVGTTYYASCKNNTCESAKVSTLVTVSIPLTTTPYTVCQNATISIGEGLAGGNSTTVNGTIVSGPTYMRGSSGTTYISSGLAVFYKTYTFVAPTSGAVTFATTAANLLGSSDTYLSLYQNSFDPASPATNFLRGDDDGGVGILSSLTQTLTAGTTYIVVVSHYSTERTGTFTLQASTAVLEQTQVNWYLNASGGSPLATGAVFNPVGVAGSGIINTATVGSTTFYVAYATYPDCRTAATFTISSQVSAPTGTANPTICSNATASLSATCATGNVKWYGSNSTTLLSTVSPFVTPNLTVNTTYNVRCENGACLSSFVPVSVTINASTTPTAPTGTANSTICSNATASLSATCTTGNVKWYGSNSTTLLSTVSPFVTPNLTAITTYNVRCENSPCNSAFIGVNVTFYNSIPRLYVDASKTTGANTGLSWIDAFTDLQSALNRPCTSEIWVAAGTYKPTTTTDKTISFVMKNDLAIYGGFAGTETSLTQRNYTTNITILSGDIGTANNNTDNSYHVVLNTSINSTAILDGFTITQGNADISINRDGAGMSNNSSSPTITNCTFSNNTSGFAGNGGGMHNSVSNPIITNCTFSGNTTGLNGNGGGMSNNVSNPIITNCTFSGNTTGLNGNGGGMSNNSSSPIISNCTFIANTNSSNTGTGGGLYYDTNSGGTIKNCIFYKNIGNTANRNNIYKTGTATTLNLSYSIVDDYDATNSIDITWGLGINPSNPFFVNDADPDGADNVPRTADDGLQLTSCSPAINAGTNTDVSATDILSNSRIFNTTADLGAYEFQSNSVFPVSNPDVLTNLIVCSGTTTSLSATCATGIVNWYDASSVFLATGSSYVTPNLISNAIYHVTCKNITCESDKIYNISIVAPHLTPMPYTVCQNATVPIGEGLFAHETIIPTSINDVIVSGPTFIGGYGNNSTNYITSNETQFYKTFTFVAPASGLVTFSTTAASLTSNLVDDTYITLYQSSFDNTNPANNFLHGDDDSGAGGLSNLTHSLTANTTYIVVVSAYKTGATGTFTLQLSGDVFSRQGNNWYLNASGGSPLATGSVFNPVGVAGSGISNTATVGSTTFYVADANSPDCRNASTFTIGSQAPTGTSNPTICSNATASLSATCASGNVVWYGSNSTTLLSTVSPFVTPNLTANTTYNVRCEGAVCNSAFVPVSVTINAPTAPTGTSNPTICSNATASLSATCATGNVVWYGSNSTTLLATTSPFVTPNLTANTTYNVRCENAGCNSNFVPVSVTINAPTAPTGTASSTICSNATASLSATCASGNVTWYGSNSTTLLATVSPFVTPNLTANTMYNVRCESGSCQSAFVAVNVTINAPIAPTGTANPTICSNTTTSLSATCATGNVAWYGSNSTTLLATASPFVTPNLTSSTTYYVRCEGAVCNSAFVLVSVTINPPATTTEDMTWTGAVSTDWNNACNWTPNGVPSITNYVYIYGAASTPIVSSGTALAKAIDMGNNASLTVNLGASLTINSPLNKAMYLFPGSVFANYGTTTITNPGNVGFTYALQCEKNTTINNFGTLTVDGSTNGFASQGNVNNKTGAIFTVNAPTRGVFLAANSVFINETNATFNATGSSFGLIIFGGTNNNTNAGTINVTGKIEVTRDILVTTLTTFTNQSCGVIKTTGLFEMSQNSIYNNAGFTQVGTDIGLYVGTFNNNGVLKYRNVVSGTITNNKMVITNTCQIFTLGATNNYTVIGIFTDAGATITAGTYSSVGNKFTANNIIPTGSQTLYAQVSDGTCTYTVPFDFNNAKPTAVSVNNTTVCTGASVTLSATCASGTITWYDAVSGTSIALGTGTGLTTIPVTSPTTYYASCETTNCVSGRVATNAVTVNALPTAPTGTNSPTICNNTTASLSAICASGNVAWYGSNSTTFLQTSSPFVTPNLTTATTYNVRCESGSCQSSFVAVNVNIENPPNAQISGGGILTCSNPTLSLTASGGSYSWSNELGTNPVVTISTAGTYSVTVTGANGCTATATTSVIFTNNLAPIASNTGPYQLGETISLSASGGASYAWSGPNNFTSSLVNPLIINALAINGGIYSVTVSTGICTATATTNVIINSGIDPCVQVMEYAYVLAGNPYQALFPLTNGANIAQNAQATSILVRPICNSIQVESVDMTISGAGLNWTILQNVEPFALFDNSGNSVNGQVLAPGTYSLTITGYAGDNRTGGTTYGPIVTTFTIVGNTPTISMPNFAGTEFCAGTSVNVNFTTTGTFAGGNLFNVLLSDENGNFNSPQIIGTTTVAGSVLCNIHPLTMGGENYRIKVVSTDPAASGNYNPVALTIHAQNLNLVSPTNDFSVDKNKKAIQTISATNKVISPAKVLYQAGNAIMLNAGFEAKAGTVFRAEIGGCIN